MANPTWDDGATTLTFRAGCMQARRLPFMPRQRKLVSSNGNVRIFEVSAVDEEFIEVDVISLPRQDEGSYHGRDTLLAFVQDDLNWAENTFTFTDADSDSWTVRYWSDDFLLEEATSGRRKDSYDGKILLRVEAA